MKDDFYKIRSKLSRIRDDLLDIQNRICKIEYKIEKMQRCKNEID